MMGLQGLSDSGSAPDPRDPSHSYTRTVARRWACSGRSGPVAACSGQEPPA